MENEYQDSVFDKLIEPMNDYILCQAKINQLKSKGHDVTANEKHLMWIKDQISEIILQWQPLER